MISSYFRKEFLVKKLSLLVCLLIFAAGFTGCGNEDRGTGTGHMYNAVLNGNPSSLDPQFADDAASNTVIKNLYSGLMSVDSSGNIVCCNAESYTVSDDGTVYTFSLRRDNYWFFDENDDDIIDKDEYFPVTAEDYVFALRRVLDPKMRSPFAYDFSCIKGAKNIALGLADINTAEVYAPDSYTLVIVLEAPDTEFLYLMSTAGAYPCNEEFFNSTKGRYGLDDRSVMSNGAFYVRQWFYDPYGNNNILYMRRNDANWCDSFEINPSYLSFSIERSEEDIRAVFKNDETECFTSLSNSPYNPKKYSITGISAYTLGLIFNPDDKYYSNENMRRAIALSIDRETLSGELDGDLTIAGGVIPPAVMLHGRSYRELVSDRSFVEYAPEEAVSCCGQAKSELGVQNIDSVKVLVRGDTVDSAYLHLLTQSWQELFGSYIGIEEVTEEEFYQRISAGDYSIALYPLKSRLGYGASVIAQFEDTPCLQYILGEERLTPALMSCRDSSELIDAYTEAERRIIDSCGFIPLFYKNAYLIADSDNEQIYYDPFSEAVDFRLALNYD